MRKDDERVVLFVCSKVIIWNEHVFYSQISSKKMQLIIVI